MSKTLTIVGCKTCPFCWCTDDWDNYDGYKCEKNKQIGWSENEFIKLADDFIEQDCPLNDCAEKSLESRIKKLRCSYKYLLPGSEFYNMPVYKDWDRRQKEYMTENMMKKLVNDDFIKITEEVDGIDKTVTMELLVVEKRKENNDL